jgi:putative oxidoreductase
MSTDQRDGWASLLLRSVIGATMIAHGVKHGRTLAGTAGWFESIGFRKPELQARASAAVEIGSGAALLVGAATPLSAAGVVATMIVAARTVHVRNGFFVTAEGWEYVATLGTAAVALAGFGPGPYSIDHLLGLHRRLPTVRSMAIAAGLGLAASALHLFLYWRARTHDHTMSRCDRRRPDPSRALIMRPSKHPVGHRDGTTGFAKVSKARVMRPFGVARRFPLRCSGVASTAYQQPGFVTNIVATAGGAKVTR